MTDTLKIWQASPPPNITRAKYYKAFIFYVV